MIVPTGLIITAGVGALGVGAAGHGRADASIALRSLLHRFKDGVSSAVTSRTYSKVEGGGDDEPGGDDH